MKFADKCGECSATLTQGAPFDGHRIGCLEVGVTHPNAMRALLAPSEDRVNHPGHYGGDTPYEVIKVLEHWLTREEFIGALKFNVIKYQARAAKKNGAEDYKKAAWYAQRLADYVARNPL